MKGITISGPAVLVLCSLSFFLGRFLQQSAQLPDPNLQESLSHERALLSAATEKPSLSIDPLDTAELENYMLQSTNLTTLRPARTPAASGDNFYHAIPFQILSWYPRIVLYPSFIDPKRCDAIVELAKKHLYPSGLAYRPGEKAEGEQQVRTSSGTFLSSSSDPTGSLGWLEERIAAATLIPAGYGEPFNVLHYQHMQHYDSHYDTFDPKEYGQQSSQRIATVLVYLSDVTEGGETVFKREGKDNGERVINDWRNCEDGSFKYAPRKGDAVLFWGTGPDGVIDPRALHGGCPVKGGEKWAATKWLRNRGNMPE